MTSSLSDQDHRTSEPQLLSELVAAREENLDRLFDSNIIGIITADTHGQIIRANDHFLRMLGYRREDLPLSWAEMTPPEWQDQDLVKIRELSETGTGLPWEKEYIHNDGHLVPILVGIALVEARDDEVVGFVLDLTERKKIEASLRASEERYKSLYDNIPLMYFSLSETGIILSVNDHGAKTLGYRTDELVGRLVLELFHPDDRSAVEKKLREFGEHPEGVARWEFRKICNDGTTIWVQETVMASPRSNGELTFLVVCEDVTERKRAEQQLLTHERQLRMLTSALSSAEERERRRIGRGMHDDIGQVLAVTRLKLGRLKQSGIAETATIVAEVDGLLDQAIQKTRSLVFELSSPILYELGLAAALESLGERAEESGLRFRFETDEKPREIVDDTDAIVFRATREAIHNVIKHARAENLRVALATAGAEFSVTIEDDGVGFDARGAGEKLGPEDQVGLFSIREQLDQRGGRLEIHSKPGRGTRVEIVVPVESVSD